MANEILYVPEEHLAAVIRVIRKGLQEVQGVGQEVRDGLEKWCDEEERYLKKARSDPFGSKP